ncbi:MAG: DUF819 family protein [Gemmatimonadales bacterium]
MIADPVALAAVIAAATALAFWLEGRYRWARDVGAALIAILLGAALSNLGFVPVGSPVYEGIFGPVTSLAIVWLLISVRFDDMREAGPTMLAAFLIGVAGTAIGALVGATVLAGEFGDAAWKLAGVTTGTYSGGSLNFVAVGRELGLPPSLFAAATAADNIVTAIWFGATLMLPLWLSRGKREAAAEVPAMNALAEEAPGRTASSLPLIHHAPELRTLDLTMLLALGLTLIWASGRLSAAVPAVPSILWLTTLALAAGQIPAVRRVSGAMLLGTVALHLFFTLMGISSRISEIASVGPQVLYLMAIVVGVHGLVLFGIGRLARLSPDTLSVASQAAIGGPTTAMAMAIARRWPALILPGMAVGLLGYAIGNYLGFGIAYLTRALLG